MRLTLPSTRGRDQGTALATLEFISPTAAIIARPPSRVALGVVWIMASLFGCLLAIIGLLPIDRVVAAEGRLVPLSPTILVQPLETSIIRSFEVRPNQLVRAGELLARLDPTFATADLATLTSQHASLAAEVARLEAEAAGERYRPEPGQFGALQAAIFAQREAERTFRIENFRQRMRSLSETMQRGEVEAQQLERRLAVAGQIEGMRRELERAQVGSRLNALMSTDSRIEVQRGIGVAQSQARSAARDLAAVQAEHDAYGSQWRAQVVKDLAERRGSLNDVQENLTKAQLRRQLVELRAPADAVVLELGKTSVGAVLAPGELLVSLVPLNSALEVDAQVQPRDMGFVAIGDPVKIKFETYPYIRHGTADGTVRTISEDTTRNREAATPQGERPYYRARVTLDAANLRNLPADFRLMPGMPVQADIVVGDRTILQYLFQRVLRPFREGMREP